MLRRAQTGDVRDEHPRRRLTVLPRASPRTSLRVAMVALALRAGKDSSRRLNKFAIPPSLTSSADSETEHTAC